MRIGFIGLGLMGLPMARNLAAAGHTLTVWNRSPEKVRQIGHEVAVAETPEDAARDADCIIAMLADGPITSAILDDAGIIGTAPEGAVIVDMASNEPERDQALGAKARARGVGFVDAPVSGGVPGAEAGTLTIFAGGTPLDVQAARPALEAMGRVTHVGPLGAGQTVKLANQMIVGATIGAVAEAFQLARSAGCDLATVRHALTGGFADSRILQVHGERMVTGNYVPGGRCASQRKDMDNAVAALEAAGLPGPITQTTRAAYADYVDRLGGGDHDHSAYFLWLDALVRDKPHGS